MILLLRAMPSLTLVALLASGRGLRSPVSPVPAAAIALLGQVLIPSGRLGPGTATGAAQGEVPAHNAWMLARPVFILALGAGLAAVAIG